MHTKFVDFNYHHCTQILSRTKNASICDDHVMQVYRAGATIILGKQHVQRISYTLNLTIRTTKEPNSRNTQPNIVGQNT
jgi:hypothetical protein